jgi:hypothetical protein
MWKYRERLNYYEKLRRSIYEVLREALERRLMKIALVDSFYRFQENGTEYPFLDKRELMPRCKIKEKESDLINTFIVIFCEDVITPDIKNYIRCFPENTVAKKNLEYFTSYTLYRRFYQNLRHFDSPGFLDLIEELLDIDYALLIQQDPTVKRKNRYSLTHFHVKIDWPIADAAEDLAKYLRYIQNNLYENGEKEARLLQNKLFEYYGCHHSVGGRRTAGLIAAQLLTKLNYISTVFVSSAESRAMYKYSERGVSKWYLVPFSEEQVEGLAERENIPSQRLLDKYLYPAKGFHLGISEVFYAYTSHSRPPENGKLRRLQPAYAWLRLKGQLLHPRMEALEARPLSSSWIPAA